MTTITKRARPQHRRNREDDLDAIVASAPPAFTSLFIEEPKLLFGGNNTAVDPKVGLEQFGPVTVAKSQIRVGIVGTGEGIDAFRGYLDRARNPIRPGLNSRGKAYDPLVFPDFPGVTPHSTFRTEFVTEPSLQRAIPLTLFEKAVAPGKPTSKLRQVVELILKELTALADADHGPDVVVLVMPPVVEKECATIGAALRGQKIILTPAQKIQRSFDREQKKTGQSFFDLDLTDTGDAAERGFWNIHHALKAHAMPTALSTQIVWENRLRDIGLTQDPASMAWNLFTALFYKSGNIPWQLQQVPMNTCFVGVSFYKAGPYDDADMQTSLAQVFSGAGEGLVLKGQRAVVDKKRDRKAHLDESGAEKLLRQAISLYEQHHHTKPARVVMHKTSRYWPEELTGFRKALDGIARYDFLALEKLDLRFMRMGKEPPLRGTVISIAPKHHLVFTMGYVPYFRAYPGMRIPTPVEIVEHHGDSPTEQICREILALTKVNWNSCSFACSEPITIQFARTVGRILTEVPPANSPQTKYKYYM